MFGHRSSLHFSVNRLGGVRPVGLVFRRIDVWSTERACESVTRGGSWVGPSRELDEVQGGITSPGWCLIK